MSFLSGCDLSRPIKGLTLQALAIQTGWLLLAAWANFMWKRGLGHYQAVGAGNKALPTPNAKRSIQQFCVGRVALDVGRWAFSSEIARKLAHIIASRCSAEKRWRIFSSRVEPRSTIARISTTNEHK
jgi:hypothetical protein